MDDKVSPASNAGQSSQPQIPIASSQPVSGSVYGKEQQPIEQPTYLEPEPRPEVSPELKGLVERIKDEVEIPYEAKKVGLEPAKESVPVTTRPTGTVTVPLTWQQSLNMLRIHKNIADAIVWLATWCLRQLKLRSERSEGG